MLFLEEVVYVVEEFVWFEFGDVKELFEGMGVVVCGFDFGGCC